MSVTPRAVPVCSLIVTYCAMIRRHVVRQPPGTPAARVTASAGFQLKALLAARGWGWHYHTEDGERQTAAVIRAKHSNCFIRLELGLP